MSNWLANLPAHYRWAFFAGIGSLIGVILITAQGLLLPGVHPGFADKDFANYWTAGKLILEGRTDDLFGPQPVYFAHLVSAFGPNYPWHNWSYPPHYLLIVWPLGFFGYKAAMMLFLGLSVVLYLWSVRRLGGKDNRLIWIAIIPFLAHNLWVAQNGFLFGGFALAALALREERPVLAGICLGLLTIKPQLGILFPFLLLAERRWTVIASAASSTIVLVFLSAAIFGLETWRGYLGEVVPYQTFVMRELEGTFLAMLPSAYGLLRNLGLDADAALPLHLILAIPVAACTIAAFFLVRRDEDRSILLLLATFVVTPYSLTYDLGMLAAALGLLGVRQETAASAAKGSLIAIAMLLPAVMMPLGEAHLPIAPVVILCVYVVALQQSGFPTCVREVWSGLVNRHRRPSPASASG
jgi:hypothetical protein